MHDDKKGSASRRQKFVATDLYAPVLKAHEAQLLLAIAAAEGCLVYKTDTGQAFL
jgi:hypothetical protein